LQGIAFVPAIVNGVEGLFGHKSGVDKKGTALQLVLNNIQATDAIAGKDIVDPNKFQDGLGKVIDAVVQCLKSLAWAKTNTS
jgi:delta-aminolevulinic acid dehydratase/porphobilinogen synthase